MRGESRIDEGLALQQVVDGDVDAHDELEAKEGLTERAPDGRVDHLGTLAALARPGPLRRLSSQSVAGMKVTAQSDHDLRAPSTALQ